MSTQYCVGAQVSLTLDGAKHFKRLKRLKCITQLCFRVEEVLPNGNLVLQKANELPKRRKARIVPPAFIQSFKGK